MFEGMNCLLLMTVLQPCIAFVLPVNIALGPDTDDCAFKPEFNDLF